MVKNLNAGVFLDKSNNFLSDSSNSQGQNSVTITGTTGNISDKNTTTYYEINSYSSPNFPSTPPISELTLDYGSIIWNASIFLEYYLASTVSGGTTGIHTISYSTDNTNWTDLAITANSDNKEDHYNILKFRYLKFNVHVSGSYDPKTTLVKIYECRVIGG